MNTTELKTNFHKLIDDIDNENVLIKFYEIMNKVKESETGTLWSRLSSNEQNELIEIAKESQLDDNLIPHTQMTNKHRKWL